MLKHSYRFDLLMDIYPYPVCPKKSYVGNKKTTDGFGLLLIETAENTLIWPWETEEAESDLICESNSQG
ncbi:hypothetical protein [uncultured Dysgonomonas sp.]|nr:hypothetical protein [uncultured Dysgonomonas sp.]